MPHAIAPFKLAAPDHETLFQFFARSRSTRRPASPCWAQSIVVSLGALKARLVKTLVKIGNFRNSCNRRAYAYLLTQAGVAAKTSPTASFLRKKTAEMQGAEARKLRSCGGSPVRVASRQLSSSAAHNGCRPTPAR